MTPWPAKNAEQSPSFPARPEITPRRTENKPLIAKMASFFSFHKTHRLHTANKALNTKLGSFLVFFSEAKN
jgi:hypothetical protein